MGYRISYDNERMQIEQESGRHTYSRLISVLVVCLLVLGSLKLIGWDSLKNYVLPGDPELTEAAFTDMVESIRAGESVTDAVTAFCVEIIENAR